MEMTGTKAQREWMTRRQQGWDPEVSVRVFIVDGRSRCTLQAAQPGQQLLFVVTKESTRNASGLERETMWGKGALKAGGLLFGGVLMQS